MEGIKLIQHSIDTPGYYVVCEYYPAGNVVGDNNRYFKDNVLQQTEGEPTDSVESGISATSSSTTSSTSSTSGNGIASMGSRFHDERWACGVVVGAVLVGVGIFT